MYHVRAIIKDQHILCENERDLKICLKNDHRLIWGEVDFPQVREPSPQSSLGGGTSK